MAAVKPLEPAILASWIKGGNLSQFKIVDVRDDDYTGGHLINSVNYPSHRLDRDLKQLVESTRDYKR
jgi:rhodanese-related sulfurtransferase